MVEAEPRMNGSRVLREGANGWFEHLVVFIQDAGMPGTQAARTPNQAETGILRRFNGGTRHEWQHKIPAKNKTAAFLCRYRGCRHSCVGCMRSLIEGKRVRCSECRDNGERMTTRKTPNGRAKPKQEVV